MSNESTQQKYDRIRQTIQNLVLTAYSNPNRVHCPGPVAVMEYAKRAAGSEERLNDEETFHHILHCSPCYAEFLNAREQLRDERPSKMPRRVQRKLDRTLDCLDRVIKSCSPS